MTWAAHCRVSVCCDALAQCPTSMEAYCVRLTDAVLMLQYEMADYRKKLYNDIVRRKKELRRKQREREGTSSRSRSSRPRTSGDGTDKYYRR